MQKTMKQQELAVMRYRDSQSNGVEGLLARFGLGVKTIPPDEAIPGSFWGEEEAGLFNDTLLLRPDTPLHSILHETCHYICMDIERRSGLDTDAGGEYDEENGVCYLQILLAEEIAGFGSTRMMQDMDTWGYTFRLGSARAWFEQDAEDARQWLTKYGLLDKSGLPTFKLR
jgi:hypothetical protein